MKFALKILLIVNFTHFNNSQNLFDVFGLVQNYSNDRRSLRGFPQQSQAVNPFDVIGKTFYNTARNEESLVQNNPM